MRLPGKQLTAMEHGMRRSRHPGTMLNCGHGLDYLNEPTMPNPDLNDSRNVRRNREGQQRLSTHPEDLGDTAGRAPQHRKASVEHLGPAAHANDAPREQRDPEQVVEDLHADDETGAVIRAQFQLPSSTTWTDAMERSSEFPEDHRPRQGNEPEGTDG
jgi:hypothetical protein